MRPSRITSVRASRHANKMGAIKTGAINAAVTETGVIGTHAIKPRATSKLHRNSGNSVRPRNSSKPDRRGPRRNPIRRISRAIRRCAARAAAVRGLPRALRRRSLSGRIANVGAGRSSKPKPNQQAQARPNKRRGSLRAVFLFGRACALSISTVTMASLKSRR